MPENKYLKKTKEKVAKASIPVIAKELSAEVRKINKAKKVIKVAKTPAEKEKIKKYMEIVQEKIDLVLKALTADKVDSATGAQLAKILRTLSGELVSGRGGNVEMLEKKKINININVDKMSSEELLEFLSKKSQEKD